MQNLSAPAARFSGLRERPALQQASKRVATLARVASLVALRPSTSSQRTILPAKELPQPQQEVELSGNIVPLTPKKSPPAQKPQDTYAAIAYLPLHQEQALLHDSLWEEQPELSLFSLQCLAVGLQALYFTTSVDLGTAAQRQHVPAGVLDATMMAAHRSRLPQVHQTQPSSSPEEALLAILTAHGSWAQRERLPTALAANLVMLELEAAHRTRLPFVGCLAQASSASWERASEHLLAM